MALKLQLLSLTSANDRLAHANWNCEHGICCRVLFWRFKIFSQKNISQNTELLCRFDLAKLAIYQRKKIPFSSKDIVRGHLPWKNIVLVLVTDPAAWNSVTWGECYLLSLVLKYFSPYTAPMDSERISTLVCSSHVHKFCRGKARQQGSILMTWGGLLIFKCWETVRSIETVRTNWEPFLTGPIQSTG